MNPLKLIAIFNIKHQSLTEQVHCKRKDLIKFPFNQRHNLAKQAFKFS